MSASFDRGKAFRLFEEALGMTGAARSRFLESHCAGDQPLRLEIESLLEAAAQDQQATGLLLESPEPPVEDLTGHHFGRFRLLQRIGEGGMGVVYRAERTDEIRQTVAIKLIGHNLMAAGRERFQRETQLLARLEHPMIARLIDAGIESGRAWIALEFVTGEPIDQYCESRELPLRDRVRLLADLAGTVAAAHRQLVVHRDIKPPNVLVTPDGVPKLIDFGIAAVLKDDGAAHAPTMDIGHLFTPQYAAPEQVAGEPVTVVTDVFGLGALGYRLLTGRTLYPDARGPLGYVLALTQGDVPLLSRAATAHGDARQAQRLRGDLDAIFCKATERDPQRRYLSASDLQADLQRYLEDKPVLARPPSRVRSALKFVRRNSVAVAVVLVLTVAAGLIAAAYLEQTHRTAVARDIAARRGEFLQNMLNSVDIRHGGDRAVTVASLLDRSVPQIESMAGTEPLVAASMFGMVAQSDKALARYTEALGVSTRQIQLLRANRAPDLELADALSLHGNILFLNGRYSEAEPWLKEDLQLVDTRRDAPKQLTDALEGMASLDARLDRDAAAEALFNRELAVFAATRQDFGGRRAFPLSGLASLRSNEGRYGESADYVGQALAIERRYFAPDSPDLLDAEYDYAVSLDEARRSAEGEKVFRTVLDAYRRVLGPDNSLTFETQQGLAHDLWQEGLFEQAAKEAREAAQGLSRTQGENYPWTQTAWGIYGISSCLSGHGEEGLAVLGRLAALRAKNLGTDNWATQSTEVHVGTCLIALHRYSEAEPLLLKAAHFLEKDRSANFDRTQAAYKALGDLYAASGDVTQSRLWKSKLLPASP